MTTIRRQSVAELRQSYEAEDDGTLRRSHWWMLGGFFTVLVLLVVGSLVSVPYAVLSPGPTANVLGTMPGDDAPVLEIDGLPTYPAEGELDLTTVTMAGGPGYPVDVWTLLAAWLDPSRDVFPVDEVFDPSASQEQVAEENAVMMEGSQEEATAVALRAVGQDVPTYVVINTVLDSSRAKGVLEAGDRIVSVGGAPATSTNAVRDALQAIEPGEDVAMTVERDGEELDLTVPTKESEDGRTAIGVYLALDHDFPADVTINAGDIGGPSAGLMFSLGLYDKLTPGSLAGGEHVAGTGTIDEEGIVGPIGSIKQKLAGASSAGADYFLAPASNCDEVVGNVPDGLQVVKVGSFDEAVASLEAIAAGEEAALPAC